ncbi:Uncharacterized protein FKW44_014540, partial [Caligus rogercresseyi]
ARIFSDNLDDILNTGSIFHRSFVSDTFNIFRVSDIAEEEMERKRKKENDAVFRRRGSIFKCPTTSVGVRRIILDNKILDDKYEILRYFHKKFAIILGGQRN